MSEKVNVFDIETDQNITLELEGDYVVSFKRSHDKVICYEGIVSKE